MIRHAIIARFAALAAFGFAAACASEPAESVAAAPDAARGRAYAEQRCAACHAIGAGESVSPYPTATAFQLVADTPGMTQIALNAWLHTSHPTMPDLIVPPQRVDDLWAYLETLRSE